MNKYQRNISKTTRYLMKFFEFDYRRTKKCLKSYLAAKEGKKDE